MKLIGRQTALWSAAALTLGLVAGCAGAPAGQTESGLACDWDAAAIVVDEHPLAPAGQEGELAEALVGGWQEVGYDSAAGYENFANYDSDYRFFFTSELEFLYCQDTPRTEQGERHGEVRLEGDDIVFPEARFTALTWDENAMVWLNELDGATIYLQRR